MRRPWPPIIKAMLACALSSVAVQLWGGSIGRAEEAASTPVQMRPADIAWKDSPPTLPKGAKVAILDGDPSKSGMFTMRLKMPAGYQIPPHHHPADERVTVLSGTVTVGLGDRAPSDGRPGRKLGPGSYYVNPTAIHHHVRAETDAVIQVTGIGPWGIVYVQTRP